MCNLKAVEALMVGAYNFYCYRGFQINDWIFLYTKKQVYGKSPVKLTCLLSLDLMSNPYPT